jgi:LmbE family N-acetylglucosaminyl deacetylase
VVEVGLLLRQLDGEKRVLMIGAHPDDEDTSMITALARGYGARTAYLSLTRGEGGQNLIGTELGEGLGLVRTGELLAARAIDGGEQFFTRAFDFGFSKTADEALAAWGLDEVVRDVTWVIRSFRPHVVVAVFTGTPRDGHGHHQAAGIAARRAFEVAGDARVYPDQLMLGVEAWQPSTIYQLVRGQGGERTVEIQTGRLDPLVGRSFYQIAMDSRSRHRSQDMGAAQAPGPRASGVGPAFADSESAEGEGFFAGIDTTLTGIALQAGVAEDTRLAEVISDYREAIAVAGELLHPDRPELAAAALGDAVSQLDEALSLAREAPEGPGRTELVGVLERREVLAGRALLASASVVVDLRMDRDRLVPGESAEARFIIWNGGSMDVSVEDISLDAPEGWDVTGDGGGGAVEPGQIREWIFEVGVPATAEPSRAYFLEQPRDGDLYRWPVDPSAMGLPGNPPFLNGVVELNVGDARVTTRRAATYVGVDQASGEFRLPLFVVPALSVSVEPALIAWPMVESATSRSVAMRVANLSETDLEGEVRLAAPAGWEVAPESYSFSLASGGETSFTFEVNPGLDAAPGRASFQGIARSGGREYGEGVEFIDYPHIDPAALFRPSELVVSYFPVDVAPNLRVGYVMGPGDPGLEALLDLGVQAEALTAEDVRSGDLDRFDTVVLGIRAYETREDLQAANERLLDFARRGGTVVVQYQQYQYPEGGYAPFPVDIAQPHDRVTDQNATVTLLDPEHALVATPNPLGAADFDGWVQERGLYFLGTWDPAYTPLLEMADPGEEPKRGSLLVAQLGDGAYVYTGLALFRQFAAGVPGAYRILANLVSLRGSDIGSGVAF